MAKPIHDNEVINSSADFINKLQIALKECYETDYWISIFKDANIATEKEFEKLSEHCSKIRRVLVASITTAKENINKEKQ
ncbi:MAG: four helix bundle protein [Clostridia bacterium]|nr:four helix bundle protein [Clostridia bacterium]